MYLPKQDFREAQIQQIKTRAHLQHMFSSWLYQRVQFRWNQSISHLFTHKTFHDLLNIPKNFMKPFRDSMRKSKSYWPKINKLPKPVEIGLKTYNTKFWMDSVLNKEWNPNPKQNKSSENNQKARMKNQVPNLHCLTLSPI